MELVYGEIMRRDRLSTALRFFAQKPRLAALLGALRARGAIAWAALS